MYSQYQPIIDKLVSTLRVFRQKKDNNLADLRSGKGSEDPNFADTTFNPNSQFDMQANKTKKRVDDGGGDDMLWIIAAVVVGAVVMLIMKGKKKKGKKK